MESIGELATANRHGRSVALRTDGRVYSQADLSSTVAQVTNFFSYLGVTGGGTVEIDPSTTPENVISFLATARLGAVADFEPTGDGDVIVVSKEREGEFESGDGTKLVVYGGEATEPQSYHWETSVWSERAVPYTVRGTPDDPVLATEAAPLSHGTLIDAAEALVDEYDIDEDTTVALRTPLAEPGAVVAGIIAPLSVGATVALDTTSTLGDVGVGFDLSEPVEIDPTQVL